MKLKRRQTMILGLKGTGKSNALQWLLSQPAYPSHIVIDVCQEHSRLNQYLPTHRRGEKGEAELDKVLSGMVLNAEREARPDVVAVEELSRYAPNRGRMPPALAELVDLNRHYDVGLVGIARRPSQVNTDLIEMADNLIIFRLTGKNDVRALNQMVDGLGDTVKDLDDYHFVHVRPDNSYSVMSPLPEMDTTGKL